MKKRLFIFRLALLNTFKKKLRACLAIGGIALSTAVMIVLFGIGIGLQSLVTKEVTDSGATGVVTVNQRNQQVKLNQDNLSKISSVSGVGSIEQVVGSVADMTYHGIALSMPVYGVTEGYFLTSPVRGVAGEARSEPANASNHIIISSKAAEALSLSPKSAIGRTVSVAVTLQQDNASKQVEASKRLRPENYTVTAVIDRGTLPVGYISLENLKTHGVDSVSQVKIILNSPKQMGTVRESVEQMGFQTTSVQDSIDEVNRIFSVIKKVLFIFGLIALVITVFGTFTVITLTLMEETQQVGFLRIMGMQKSDVSFLFMAQSIMLTVLGAVLGVIGGIFFGSAANGFVSTIAGKDSGFTSVYVFQIPFFQIIIIVMLSVALGWLVGTVPAKRAVKINPLEELHL